MGFDVYGSRAKSEKGEYFRNNVWWWHPLADYVLEHVDMPESEGRDWHSNSGQKVSGATALKLADTLDKLVASGEAAEYERRYKAELESLPLKVCDCCDGRGVRNDSVVQNKTCNVCDGSGKQEDWRTHYPFSADNVKEFSEFCRDSGGFRIF